MKDKVNKLKELFMYIRNSIPSNIWLLISDKDNRDVLSILTV